MNILILGLGVSGEAAIKLAANYPFPSLHIKEFNSTPEVKENIVIGIDENSSLFSEKIKKRYKESENVSILLNYSENCLPNNQEPRHLLEHSDKSATQTLKNHGGLWDLIVISPGISETSRLGKLAINSKVKIVSEIDFAALYISTPILAITGTNGKTTTTEMTTKLLKMSGLNAISAGNIGMPLSEIASQLLSETISVDAIVLELSSFQLERSKKLKPTAAAILNIESDHMDRYANFANYCDAKFKIFDNISSDKNMIIEKDFFDNIENITDNTNNKLFKNSNTPVTFSIDSNSANIFMKNNKIFFNPTSGFNCTPYGRASSIASKLASLIAHPLDVLFQLSSKLAFSIAPMVASRRNEMVIDLKSSKTKINPNIAINSPHNITNLMVAIFLASKVQPITILKKVLPKFICEFRNSPHRQELIAIENNITFINDSKSTNPASIIAALKNFGEKNNICLIAGGLDKKMDFSGIKNQKEKIKSIFLVGESKKALETLWKDDIHCIVCVSFKDAIYKATEKATNGDIVLLSPGCASMDMFENYKKRGNKFKSIVHNMKKGDC